MTISFTRRFSFALGSLILISGAVLLANGFKEGSSFTSAPRVRLAATTSTDNSGLLADILPVFTEATGLEVDLITVGTGRALALGKNGDVDVLMVHAPALEQAFVDAGFGVNHRSVMYNDFVILGPQSDPAGIAGIDDAAVALSAIARAGKPFVSRGDDSGTHTKERELWSAAGTILEGDWYREAGQGMGAVITIASEVGGYTLTDRGTWLAMKEALDLVVLVEGDPRLFNPYGIIAVNPNRHAQTNYMGAMGLIVWITSPAGQKRIGDFKIGDETLFVPDAVAVD